MRSWCRNVVVLALGLQTAIAARAQDARTDLPSLRAVGQGLTPRVARGVFSPDGMRFYATGVPRAIRAWNVADGKELFALKGHKASVNSLALAGDRLLVTGGEDGSILLWDLSLQKQVGQLPGHEQPIHCVAVSRDGKLLATGGGTWNKPLPGELRLWDLGKRAALATLAGHRHQVLGVDFAPDGKTLAAVDRSGDVKVWDLATRRPTTFHLAKIPWSVQFSPDGKWLAIGDMWGHLRLYDAGTLNEDSVVRGHRGTVFCLSYAPRANMLASAGYDGAVRLWNPLALEDQAPLTVGTHKGIAWLVAFSPDGRTLASGGNDGLVNFWAIPAATEKRFRPPVETVVQDSPVSSRARPAKVAIVSAQEETARNVQDLALAKLTGTPGLEMLERSTVDRLLREQALSVAGLVDASTAVQAGKILAVDLLAVVESSRVPGHNSGIAVFDAATGVKLIDAGFTAADLEPQALQTSASVRAAVASWRAGPKHRKTVCFLPVRNADLPRGMDRFCEALATTLERDLLATSSAAVLERKRLDLVNKEKTLAQDAATRALLASLTVIEMDVSRGRQGQGIRATVTLRDNAGKALHKFTHEVADPNGAGVLPPLVQQIQEALHTTPVNARANRNRESRRFLREAQLLWKHKYYVQGLQAAEAAFALKPGEDARLLLTEYLLCYATELVHPGGMRTLNWGSAGFNVAPDKVREAMVLARRGMQLIDTARAALKDRNDTYELWRGVESPVVTEAQRIFYNKLPYVKVVPVDAEAQAEYDDFRRFCLQRVANRCYEAAQTAERDAKALARYTSAITAAVENVGRAAPTPLAYTKTQCDLARHWLELVQALQGGGDSHGFGRGVWPVAGQRSWPVPNSGNAHGSRRAMTLDLLAQAARHPHPLVRLYAVHDEIRLSFQAGQLSRADAIARHRAMLAEGKRLIDNPPLNPPDPFRIAMYRLLGNAIGRVYLYQKGADVLHEYFDLCDFMLARGDVCEDIINEAVTYGSPLRELNLKALQIIDRAVQVTDSPNRRLFDGFPDRFKNHHMKPARHKLLTKLPDLLKIMLPWESVTPLVRAADLNATVLLPAQVHGSHIYLFAGGEDPATKHRLLQFVRLPVAGGTPQVLGKTLVSVDNPPEWSRQYVFWISPHPFVTSTAIAGDRLYAGTVSDGILVFPLGGGTPTRIGEKEGLPARHVTKIAIVDKMLIAALEGGYLVAYDLATGRCDTVASSRRGEKHSPFDDAGPFSVAGLAADPERERVLFTLTLTTRKDPREGLWEFNVKTRQFRKVQPVFDGAWSPVTAGRLYLYQPDGLLAYDLAADRFTLLYGKASVAYGSLKPTGLPADFSMTFPRRLLHHCYLWQDYPFGRRTEDGMKEEFYPSIRYNTLTYAFSATTSLRAAEPE